MKKAGTILLIFILLYLFFLGGRTIKQRWIVEKTLNSTHWKQRQQQLLDIKSEQYKIVFLGNSLTELFDLPYYFGDSTILNSGIVGDFSEGLLKRIDAVIKLKPKKLFIEIGINDIIEKISLPDICNNYEQLINIVQKQSPETKIYIQSNLPVIINRPSILTSDKDVNDLVLQQNKNLQAIASKYNCTYIDIYTQMIKEKDKSSLFIWDGIHLTPKAYSTWHNKVKPYVEDDK
jgi:lysophospholipase L1-like esterase